MLRGASEVDVLPDEKFKVFEISTFKIHIIRDCVTKMAGSRSSEVCVVVFMPNYLCF